MITLITGVPGSGKTAYALDLMVKHLASDDNKHRPLFVHGIPDLKLPHETVICSSHSCDCCPGLPPGDYLKADQWHIWAPDGAVLFFDEVQTIHRPRASTAKVPDVIAAYEIHRHRGLDFFLITQNPNLFDTNVRRLVSKHIHLTTNWMHRIQYEWPECQNNVQSTSTAIKSTYRLPKQVFKLYKSASLHTKVKRKIPFVVYAIAALLIFLGWSVLDVKNNLVSRSNPKHHQDVVAPVETASTSSTVTPEQQAQQLHASSFDYKPIVEGVAESAPAYSAIAKPVVFPILSGCVKSSTKCQCYTQQGTRYELTPEQCQSYLNRPRFNPYRQDERRITRDTMPVIHSASQPVKIN